MYKMKIGPNERTGMNKFFVVELKSKKYSEGMIHSVSINENVNGTFMRSSMAIDNGYWGYKNKSAALRLYKQVINVVRNSGNADIYEQSGATKIKG